MTVSSFWIPITKAPIKGKETIDCDDRWMWSCPRAANQPRQPAVNRRVQRPRRQPALAAPPRRRPKCPRSAPRPRPLASRRLLQPPPLPNDNTTPFSFGWPLNVLWPLHKRIISRQFSHRISRLFSVWVCTCVWLYVHVYVFGYTLFAPLRRPIEWQYFRSFSMSVLLFCACRYPFPFVSPTWQSSHTFLITNYQFEGGVLERILWIPTPKKIIHTFESLINLRNNKVNVELG